MIRLGLCCTFFREPIRFRVATATYLKRLGRPEQLNRLGELCLGNAQALLAALEYCGAHNIGCFRVNSQIFPLKTHPDTGYDTADVPQAARIRKVLSLCRQKAVSLGIRISFHPDQFVVLSSPDADIVRKSIEELDYQAEVSGLIGADVINIHAGGAYGDKPSALKRLGRVVSKLKSRIRERLAIENDDRVYTPGDVLPFCREYGIPFVYDVHHHRCLPDGLTVRQVTRLALKTWRREPLFHISSPRNGWSGANPRMHHDYIDPKDFPAEWRGLNITVEVEAKAKELAVKKLARDLRRILP